MSDWLDLGGSSNGTRTLVKDDDGNLIIRTEADITAHLDQNKAQYNSGWNGSNTNDNGFGRKMASIPDFVIAKWFNEGLNFYDKNDWPEIRRRLNSSEYEWLRTAPGRI